MSALSAQQRAALEGYAACGGAAAHARTITSLIRMGLMEAQYGWVNRSVSRRVGRLFATSTEWGVVGYRITEAGRTALEPTPCICTDGRVQQATARGHYISLPCPTCTPAGGAR